MTIRNSMGRLLTVLLLAAALSVSAFGQGRAALTTTTLSVAIPAAPATNQQAVTTITVGSATGMVANGLPNPQGGLGGPNGSVSTFLFVDRELMRINSINGTSISVGRGVQGTAATAHASGATVYVATGRQLVQGAGNPGAPAQVQGSCNSTFQPVAIPFIDPATGLWYDCPTTGPFLNTWVVGGVIGGYNVSSTNLNPNTIQTVSIPLTLAQLQTTNTVPIKLIPAQGAGTLIEVVACTLDLKFGSAAFTGGGTTTIGWGSTTSTTAATATIASTVFTTFTASQAITAQGSMAVTVDTLTLNLPVWLSTASANFAAGTGGTGVIDCSYRVHSGF